MNKPLTKADAHLLLEGLNGNEFVILPEKNAHHIGNVEIKYLIDALLGLLSDEEEQRIENYLIQHREHL